MTPTNELRFVEREVVDKPMTAYDHVYTTKIVRVLQQKWRHKDYPIVIQTEWRDVPLVKDEA